LDHCTPLRYRRSCAGKFQRRVWQPDERRFKSAPHPEWRFFVASHSLRWGSQEDRKVCRFMRKLRSRFANPACPITMGFGNVW
ncbi:hypothetical protein DF22_003322, partial [Xylella fastidiosa]